MNIHKNQRGIAHIAIILVVLVLAIAGAGYYFVTKANKDKDDSTGGNPASQQAAEDSCSLAIDDKDLCKAASKIDAGGNYTITMVTTSADGTATMTLAYDGDNYHMTTRSSEGDAETISVDDAFFVRAGGSDTWIKYPAATPDTSAIDEVEKLDFSEENIASYTKAGKEPCGTLTCFHYRYTDPAQQSASYDLWFDDKDYLMRKITGTDENGSLEMTYSYGGVTITAPQNFQEMPGAGL